MKGSGGGWNIRLNSIGTESGIAGGSCFWRPPEPWSGRVDDPENPTALRWHQIVQPWDGVYPVRGSTIPRIWLIGCSTDIGVSRNRGRPGAARGPRSIRRALANLPVRFGQSLELMDAGDIEPRNEDLEGLMGDLETLVAGITAAGDLPVVLGGGHEIAYGHHRGLVRGLAARSLPAPGIVSFDAHFDLRPEGPGQAPLHSGNMFRLLARESAERGEPFDYTVIGIQRSANTLSLFQEADRLGVRYLPARDAGSPEAVLAFLRALRPSTRLLQITLCVDVISAAHAPAVSAPQPFGLDPNVVLEGLRHLANSGRAAGLDIAEVSPRYKGDDSTAHLAALLLFAWVNAIAGVE